jgi:dihydroorotate dehydrogenase
MDLSRLAFPLLRHLDPETAHGLTIWGLARGFGPAQQAADDPVLRCRLWGYDFPNPVGIAAGFDKNGEAFDPLLRAGFGFTEVGTVTPRPQAGNPRPRLFRLAEDAALINRMGFNNEGLDKVANRLSNRHGGVVGANIGRNKDSTDADRDYAAAAGRLAPLIEYLVINVSSPNTPGLRALQDRKALESLIRRVRAAMRDSVVKPPALLVKIAPDLTPEDEADIAALAEETNLQGLIVSNTTIERPATLTSSHKDEAGGLSGAPLFAMSTAQVGRIYKLTGGRIPLVGAGGIASGRDAYAKIRAGASLVQLYSALAMNGPGLLPEIKRELASLIRADGFQTVSEAVGADHA